MEVNITGPELGMATHIEVIESIQDHIRHKDSSNQVYYFIILKIADRQSSYLQVT